VRTHAPVDPPHLDPPGNARAALTIDAYARLLKGLQKVAAEALDRLLAR
jgi:hypothetical protein